MTVLGRCAATAAVLLAASGCGLLPGSGPDPAPPAAGGTPAVAVVAGAHAGAPRPDLTPDVAGIVRDAVEHQGSLALVVDDRTPTVDRSAVFARDCGNQWACATQTDQQYRGALAAVAGLRADRPEVDLLMALDVAARALPGAGRPRTVVVVDSGLSTAGALRFQEPGVLAAPAADVADFLAARRALPDLTGVTVVLSGLGDTSDPQPAPSIDVRRHLGEVWTAIVRRAGAADVRVVDDVRSTPPAPGAPPVTTVAMPSTPSFAGRSEFVLADTVVGFAPDSEQLRDPAATRTLLTPLAGRVRGEGLRVHITGTTSSAGTEEGRRALSQARAAAVAAVLTELGVQGDRITVEGAGYLAQPPDHDDGGLLPGPAAQNRRVVIRLDPA